MNSREWQLGVYLPQLIGRTVKKVICCEPGYNSDSPAQFVMEMDNDTTYELYGLESLGITGLRHDTPDFCEDVFSGAAENHQAAAFADGNSVRFYQPDRATKEGV